jgi:capsular polysaccharide biosynthesis protein
VRFKSYLKKYFKSIQKIDEVILGIQDWDHNYFHWMTEVLPAILAMRERKSVPVLLNSNSIKQKHIVNSLELFQIPFVIHDIYNKTGRISKLHMVKVPVVAEYNEQVMFKLQHYFYEKLGIGSQSHPGKKIYISREKANRRKVSNENELISMLVNKGFEVVYLEEYSLAEQVILLSEAETVVGIHGAGLTNIMFMKPTTTVIELKAKDNDYWCFFSLARLFNLKYKYLLCDTDGTSHRDANIEVPIQQLKKIIL